MTDAAITTVPRLDDAQLAAVADLERRVVEHDGGRLKLAWSVLRDRRDELPSDLLCVDGTTLRGFAGLYQFGASVEIAGMVDPVVRRRGVGAALARAALGLVADRGADHALLVCPRTPTGGGAGFAQHLGGSLDHSEHAMLLPGEPTDGPSDPAITLRPAVPGDAARVRALLLDGFGFDDPDVEQRLSDAKRQVIVERDGAVIGYAGLNLDSAHGTVYGFVIDAGLRGRGIGRDALRRMCRSLRDEGAQEIGLEVAVENEHALGLYTSLGFRPVITEDYFRLAVS